jgi:hypothetical protein
LTFGKEVRLELYPLVFDCTKEAILDWALATNKANFMKTEKDEIVTEILSLLHPKCCDMECWPTLSKEATLLLFGNYQECCLTTEKLLLHNYECSAKLIQHLIEDPQEVPLDLLTFLVFNWFPENNNNFLNLLVKAQKLELGIFKYA